MVIRLMRQLVELLAIRLSEQATLAKSLVIAIPLMELLAIPLGYPKTVAKWLVISNRKTVASGWL